MTGRDFISLGKRLQAADTEAELTTSISRAYYGLFHVVCQGLSRRGVPFHEHADDHRLVVNYLLQGTSRLIRIGTALGDLRKMRNKADYVLSILIAKGDAQEAFKNASTAADEFEALSEPEIQSAIKRMRDLR